MSNARITHVCMRLIPCHITYTFVDVSFTVYSVTWSDSIYSVQSVTWNETHTYVCDSLYTHLWMSRLLPQTLMCIWNVDIPVCIWNVDIPVCIWNVDIPEGLG